jgi:hypothetical protein
VDVEQHVVSIGSINALFSLFHQESIGSINALFSLFHQEKKEIREAVQP